MTTKGPVDAKALLEELDGPLTFGEALRSIRVCDEETQEHFAARLGISKQHLCDLEKGRRMVGPARAASWGKLLGYGEATFVRLALRALLEAEGVPYDVKIVPYKATPRRRVPKRRAA
jgi:transcriptional regulator with XRE-family HTH domain